MSNVVGVGLLYTVHVVESYSNAPVSDREGRVQYALKEQGVSILSGFITTAASCCFLLFSSLNFLFKFSVMLLSQVFIGTMYCLFFLLPLLCFLGPEGHTGKITNIYYYCTGKVREEDTTKRKKKKTATKQN